MAVAGAVAGYFVARNSSAAKAGGATTAANSYGFTYGSGSGASGHLLARLDQVPAGGGVVLAQQDVVLTRDAGGAVHAFSATCTHQGCTVDGVSNGVISCPCHGSRFDARTGAVVAGPAPRPLPAVSVTVRNGGVYTS